MLPAALVVQCFVKVDTLNGLCASLLRCDGIEKIDLIFWCDSAVNSRSPGRYEPLARDVKAYIESFSIEHGPKFKSVQYKQNEINLGTCKTCEVALNYAFLTHEFVIFVEDDVIFSIDALAWFSSIRNQNLLADSRYWAITGESIFFNAQERPIPSGWREKMIAVALDADLVGYYITHNFLPSTCFATTREKWQEFGTTRGQPLGDGDVCKRCSEEDKHGIFPVVPRVKDIGMLHENGYSVMIHTMAGVKEIKNTYLLSEDLLGHRGITPACFKQLVERAGDLFAESTKLLTI